MAEFGQILIFDSMDVYIFSGSCIFTCIYFHGMNNHLKNLVYSYERRVIPGKFESFV